MKKLIKTTVFLIFTLLLASCSNEVWTCRTEGKTMFSMSSSGKLGSAGKGCSCEQIRSFELREFGSVDEQALKNDFGC